jgi:DNA-binding SARP family transcriptional activator
MRFSANRDESQRMDVRVGLAGQLLLTAGDRAVDEEALGGRRGRVLFAYLVAERSRPATREELADVLWGEDLPPTWQPALRTVLSTIRAALTAAGLPGAETLTGAAGRYQLVLPAGTEVDVEVAERDVAVARRLVSAGEPERAAEHAEAARSVAARSFLPGVEGEWVDRLRARFAAVLVAALELASESLVGTGDGAAAVRPAEEAVALEPFRESAHLRLMLAHAAAGNRGEALRAYERFRKLLAEELGVDPSPQLATAYLELLRSEPDPPALPAPGPPTAAGWAPAVPFNALAGVGDPDRGRFVGRQAELTRLHRAWRQAVDGRRQVVVVTGEAGIGKTRLAAELGRIAQAEGGTVLYGRCDEKLTVAYLGFREALGGYLAARPTDTVGELVRDAGGELARLLPELTRRLPDLPVPEPTAGPDQRYDLFESVAGLLAGVSATSPVLLVIDDLQWAGTEQLLLRHVARSSRQTPLLLLVTYRSDQDSQRLVADTVADLQREPGFSRLALAGLGRSEVDQLVGVQQHAPAPEGLASMLLARTDGNPFLLGELLRHLAETGGLDHPDAVREALEGVPEGVRHMLEQRLSRLDPAVTGALDLAAVIGRDFDLAVLTQVSDLEHEVLLDALDAAVAAGLVLPSRRVPGRYGFSHVIVRDAVYGRIPAARRRRLHLRIGEALERLPAGDPDARLSQLTRHLGAAASSGSEPGVRAAEKAVDYASAAADRAISQFAYAEAVRLLGQALAHLALVEPADRDRRCDLLLELGSAQVRLGRVSPATDTFVEAFELAAQLRSVERMTTAALGIGGGATIWFDGDGTVPARLLRQVLAAIGPTDSPARALVLSRLARWVPIDGPPEEVEALSGEAVDVARRVGDPGTFAAVLVDRTSLLGSEIAYVREEETTATELLQLADQLGGVPSLRFVGHYWHVYCALVDGRPAATRPALAAMQAAVLAAPTSFVRWAGTALEATVAIARGDLAGGERLAREAEGVGVGGSGLLATAAALHQVTMIRWLRGQEAESVGAVERLVADFPVLPLRSMLAWLYAEVGRAEEARAIVAGSLDEMRAGPTRIRSWRTKAIGFAKAAVALGDRELAAALFDQLSPYREQHLLEGTGYQGAAAYHLGQLAATLGDWEVAERHLVAAVESHRRLGAEPWVALSQHALAGVLRVRGARDRAEVVAAAARALGTALGLRPLGGPLLFESPAG